MDLEASNAVLLSAIKAAPVQLAVFDADMRYVAASDLWVERHGLASTPIVGLPRYELSESQFVEWKADFLGVLSNRPSHYKRQRRTDSDGHDRWECCTLRRWETPGGSEQGVIACLEDVTLEVRRNTELEDAHVVSDLLQEMSLSGLWRCDLKQKTIYWSEVTRRVLGLGAAEAASYQAYLDAIHPADQARVAKHWENAVARETAESRFEIEHRIIVDGDTFWVRKVFIVERDLDGTACSATGVLQDVSQVKRRNAEFRLSTSRLRGLFDHIGLGVVLIDKDGYFVEVNDQFCRISGHQAADLVGRKRWVDLLPQPPEAVSAISLRELVAKREATLVAEGQFDRRDGVRIWARISAFAILDQAGELIEIAATIEDITERKAQEAALMESEERFRRFFSAIGVGAVQLDPDWTFRDVNGAFCRMLGYEREEIVGRINALDLSPPEDRDMEDLRRAGYFFSGEDKFRYYKRFQCKSGGIIHVRVTAAIILDGKNKPLSIVAIVENISEIERIQNALLESERKLRLAVEAAGLGVWEFDPLTGATSWNPRLCRMMGYDEAAVTPSYDAWKNHVLAEDVAIAEAKFNASFRDGMPFINEFRVKGRNNEICWLEAHGRSLLDRRGRPTHSYGVVFDQTERKRKEALNAALLGEINHRAKNLLAVVQGIAFQTAQEAGGHDFYASLSGRLFGLSASHDLLVRTGWTGVDLNDLVLSQLAHLEGMIPSRIVVSGPPVMLRPAAAQAIGMAIHELSTNAVKYGALSNTQGKVKLNWETTKQTTDVPAQIKISWAECAGPPVNPPSGKGFGYSVMVTTCEHLFECDVQLDYSRDGVKWILEADLDKLRASTSAKPALRSGARKAELMGEM